MRSFIIIEDEPSEDHGYTSVLGLVMTIFRLTAQDLKYGNTEIKNDAIEFLESAWFDEMCSNMNLDSDRVRRIIVTSQKTSSRTSYE
jgi:hypothetical protein